MPKKRPAMAFERAAQDQARSVLKSLDQPLEPWRHPMHRSSESIAALAAALAKAQSELSNPEKSLVATIGGDRPGERLKSFRYAPLSIGLDIVRKALGQQQIA